MKRRKKESGGGHRRLNVATNIKMFSDGTFINNRSPVQLIREKVIDETDSPWYSCDVLYYVSTQKRGPASSSIASPKSERFLFLLRKKENNEIFLVHIVCKSLIVEIRNSWSLKLLRAIDLGEDDNEFILSFDSADYSWHAASQLERDETVWILAQVCKIICQQDLSLGYSVDMDLLGYATKTNGTLSKFPLLKVLGESSNLSGDIFAAEETEAESLLDELRWASEAPTELLHTLSQQSESLNMEIIDFLLQWEEEEDSQNKAVVAGKSPAATGLSSTSRLTKDDSEVMEALNRVDLELEAVDEWIGDQLSRLAETQKKLSLIESESGTLETSYQNLQSIEVILDSLLKGLSMNPEEENILARPYIVLDGILQASTLKNVGKTLQPLLDAAAKLQNSLSLKAGSFPGITPMVWKQIQAMTAVTTQRMKLQDLSDQFCKYLGDHLSSFLDKLLKHKYINDPSKPHFCISLKHLSLPSVVKSCIYLPGATLPVEYVKSRREQTKSLAAAVERTTIPEVDEDGNALLPIHESPVRPSTYEVPNGVLYCLTGLSSEEENEAFNSQRVFHNTLSPFLPLLERLVSLDSSYTKSLCRYYTLQPAQDKMYNPLFKVLFKDIKAVVTPTPTLAMSSLPSYRSGRKFMPIIRFLPSIAGTTSSRSVATSSSSELQLNAWTALAVILVVITPIVQREEDFFLKMFPMDRAGLGINELSKAVASDREAVNRGEVFLEDFKDSHGELKPSEAEKALSTIFDGCSADKILAAISLGSSSSVSVAGSRSTSVDADGLEAIAMLVVLQQFFVDQFGISLDDFEPVIPPEEVGSRLGEPALVTGYIVHILIDLRSQLLRRVAAFTAEQMKWISAQKGDPKKASVSSTVKKFPTLFMQVGELIGDKRLGCVEQMFHKLTGAMTGWINELAGQNEKYADVVRIHNFGYLERCIADSSLECLRKLGQYCGSENAAAGERYVQWMVEYEFPALSLLSKRMGSVGGKIREDELGLYVRRKDVMSVVKELEKNKLEDAVSTMKKRLDRHFTPTADDEGEASVAFDIWDRICNHMVGTVRQLEIAAASSFQITLESGPAALRSAFNKHRGETTIKKTASKIGMV